MYAQVKRSSPPSIPTRPSCFVVDELHPAAAALEGRAPVVR
jgi:hypothetical protein